MLNRLISQAYLEISYNLNNLYQPGLLGSRRQ